MLGISGKLTREVLFDLLAYARVRVVEHVSNEVDTASCDWEYLVIVLDFQLELLHVELDVGEKIVKLRLVLVQYHNVVGISVVILNSFLFLQPVVEV